MDGQRRISQSLRRFWRRRLKRKFDVIGASRLVHFCARGSAVLLLGGALLLGLSTGGELDAAFKTSRGPADRFAQLIGFAASNIAVTGLTNHDAEQLLKVIGVKPGQSLIGFAAGPSKRLLEGIDWVEEANIVRKFPNQLEISLVERKPFALWQRGNEHYVIDRHGSAMSGIAPSRTAQLPLVSGEGANLAVADLMDNLALYPELLVRVGAAARVGHRRWTLYLDNGVKILLPENEMPDALRTLIAYDKSSGLLTRGVVEIDLRDRQKMRVALAELPEGTETQ